MLYSYENSHLTLHVYENSHLMLYGKSHLNRDSEFHSTLQLLFVPCGAVERLPVLHHSADYITLPLRSLGPSWYLWKWGYVYARGCRKQCCKLHYCLWRVSVKQRLPFSSVFFVFKGNLFDVTLFPRATFIEFTCPSIKLAFLDMWVCLVHFVNV